MNCGVGSDVKNAYRLLEHWCNNVGGVSAYFRIRGEESAAMPFKARSDSLEEGKRGRIQSALYEAE